MHIKSKMSMIRLLGMLASGILIIVLGIMFLTTDILTIRKFGLNFLVEGNLRYIIGGILILIGGISMISTFYQYRHPVHLEFNEEGVTFYEPKIELVPWEDIISIEKAVDKKQRVLISYNKNIPIRFVVKNKPEYKVVSKTEESSFEILFEVLDTEYSTNDLYDMLNEYYKR